MAKITLNNASLSYTDQGSGPAIILLHGFPLDSRMWDDVVPELSKTCRVITLDQRGFGQSDPTGPFTLETLADDAYLLIQALEIEPCVLAGLSMGGYVAEAFVKKYCDALKGLILLDTKAENDSPQGKEGRNKMIELVKKDGPKAVSSEMLPKMLAPDTVKNRPAVRDALVKIMEACPAQTIQHALAAMRDREDSRPLLPQLDLPTLLIFGDQDAISPLTLGQQMREALPNAELVTIQGAGHMSPMEQPQQVSQAIRQFMQKVGR